MKEDDRVTELVKFLVCERKVLVTLINWKHLFQFISETNAETPSTLFHNMKLGQSLMQVCSFMFFRCFILRRRREH